MFLECVIFDWITWSILTVFDLKYTLKFWVDIFNRSVKQLFELGGYGYDRSLPLGVGEVRSSFWSLHFCLPTMDLY